MALEADYGYLSARDDTEFCDCYQCDLCGQVSNLDDVREHFDERHSNMLSDWVLNITAMIK